MAEVVFFEDEDGHALVLEWLDQQSEKVRRKCIVRIERLAEMGHQLRRPEADYLRDGIYELRVSRQGIHHRILYFFHEGRAVLSQGLIKEGAVPDVEIDRAIERKTKFESNPTKHTHQE